LLGLLTEAFSLYQNAA